LGSVPWVAVLPVHRILAIRRPAPLAPGWPAPGSGVTGGAAYPMRGAVLRWRPRRSTAVAVAIGRVCRGCCTWMLHVVIRSPPQAPRHV